MKTIIIGGPRTGKSTLALSMGVPVYCADPISLVKDRVEGVTYLPDMKWEDQSEYICKNWFPMEGDWVIEGVGVVRALRKAKEIPCDRIFYLNEPKIELSKGQRSMTKAIEGIWNEIKPRYFEVIRLNFKSIKEWQRQSN